MDPYLPLDVVRLIFPHVNYGGAIAMLDIYPQLLDGIESDPMWHECGLGSDESAAPDPGMPLASRIPRSIKIDFANRVLERWGKIVCLMGIDLSSSTSSRPTTKVKTRLLEPGNLRGRIVRPRSLSKDPNHIGGSELVTISPDNVPGSQRVMATHWRPSYSSKERPVAMATTMLVWPTDANAEFKVLDASHHLTDGGDVCYMTYVLRNEKTRAVAVGYRDRVGTTTTAWYYGNDGWDEVAGVAKIDIAKGIYLRSQSGISTRVASSRQMWGGSLTTPDWRSIFHRMSPTKSRLSASDDEPTIPIPEGAIASTLAQRHLRMSLLLDGTVLRTTDSGEATVHRVPYAIDLAVVGRTVLVVI